MKKILFVLILLIIFPTLSVCGDEEYKKIEDVNVPDSMEVIKEGDVNVMVPKGGQLNKESSFLVKEVPDEYASRKFIEMEAYFNDIKKELEEQRKELKDLKDILDKLLQEKNNQKPTPRNTLPDTISEQ